MTIPLAPVVAVDIVGSILILLIAVYCAIMARKWTIKKPDDVFRNYIYLLTLAIVFFAVSRSFGHLIKHVLLLSDMAGTWKQISPFSGAINSVAFVVIFAFGIYFHRFQKVHLEIENYKNNLENMISIRTEELEESKMALETILNNSNPLCITSVDHEVIQANKAYYSIWPKAGSGSQPAKCYDERPGTDCHTDTCPLKLIIEGEEEAIHEVAKIVNGGKREFIVTARPIKNIADKVIGIVESFQDITDRRGAEIALASERERLAVTLRSIGDGVITTDLEGKIVLINKVTEQLTGWSQEEASGRSVAEVFNIINERTGQPCSNPSDKVIACEKIIELESNTALISRDGTQYSIEDSAAPIFDKNSKIIGTVLVFRDVSGKRKTEEELQKIKKLESVGVLAGGIAHDFNNILVAILGNIEISLRDATLTDKTKRLLDQAKKAACRAGGLTQQLLTFAKGGQPIKETASLVEVVKDSADFVLRGTKVSCQYSFPDDLWLVDIDKGQISQVAQNLVINAIDAMPDGGKIVISCQNVNMSSTSSHISQDEAMNYVTLQVKDSGPGIPQADLDKIFDPYFSTKQKGSGLGLAITHSIISKHGGRIRVQSTPGSGTTFSISLPATACELPSIQHAEKVSGKTKCGRILVMDDDELVRSVTREMLTEMGHKVLLAKDGEEAIKIYQEALDSGSPIDLTIMDLTIPGGMGGQEAVQELLAVAPQAKAIVSSGYSNDPIMSNHKEHGFCAAISKPHQLDDLEKLLASLLDQQEKTVS